MWDVRLAIAAAAAWLVLALCLPLAPLTTLLIAGWAGVVGTFGIVARHRWPSVGATIAAVGFCIALVLVPFAGRLWQAHASPLMMLAAQHVAVTAELTVAGDPHTLAATGVAGAPRVSVETDGDVLDVAGARWTVSGPVLVLAPEYGWGDVLPGQRVRIDGTLQPSLDAGSTGATLFAQRPPELIGRPPWWQRVAGTVRSGLRAASGVLPIEERGLLPGLVDGDTNGLDPVLIERFRIAGLTHLVAVSGTNCSIVLGIVLLVLRRAGTRPWVCGAVGALVLVAFVAVARPSPSVLRAALMAGIALGSLAAGRPRQAVPALSATVLALLIWSPTLCTDAGFAMSALATAALLLIAPGWAARLRRWHVPIGLAEAIAVAAAAHAVTAPVIAAISGRVSLVAIPANVLAEPAVAPATVFGFVAAAIAPVWLGGAQVLAWLAGWPCRWLVLVAERLGGLDGASLTWPGGLPGALALLAVIATILFLARRPGIWRLLAVGAVLAALVQIPVRAIISGWPPPGWVMVACDIGQGDAIVLPAAAQTAVVIDAGPDPVAVDHCLRGLGISRVALLIFSHYHLDHVGGIVGVFHDRTVDRVITGPLAEPASGVTLVHGVLAQHGLAISTPPAGSQFDVGQVHLQVLAPQVAFHDTRSDPNNSSLVLRATVGDTSILLPGDVEVEAQQTMMAARIDVNADVLKVPHHGSAYFDPDFLAAVHARVAVISVGLHNDYGHPSPLLLTELAKLGVPVRRTDLDGDVAVVGPSARLTTVQRGTAASELATRGPTRHSRGTTAVEQFTRLAQSSISRASACGGSSDPTMAWPRSPSRVARSPPREAVTRSAGARCPTAAVRQTASRRPPLLPASRPERARDRAPGRCPSAR
jgi:competence protein ComEC